MRADDGKVQSRIGFKIKTLVRKNGAHNVNAILHHRIQALDRPTEKILLCLKNTFLYPDDADVPGHFSDGCRRQISHKDRCADQQERHKPENQRNHIVTLNHSECIHCTKSISLSIASST